jgi:vancomycin permeability regulator SanA
VILGNKVNEDGTLSTRLEKRLETGIALYQQHRIQKILVREFGKGRVSMKAIK